MTIADIVSPEASGSTVLGELFALLATTVFLLTGGHRQLLAGLLDTFAWMPPGQVGFSAGLTGTLSEVAAQSFLLAVRVAAPVLLSLVVTAVGPGIDWPAGAAVERAGVRSGREFPGGADDAVLVSGIRRLDLPGSEPGHDGNDLERDQRARSRFAFGKVRCPASPQNASSRRRRIAASWPGSRAIVAKSHDLAFAAVFLAGVLLLLLGGSQLLATLSEYAATAVERRGVIACRRGCSECVVVRRRAIARAQPGARGRRVAVRGRRQSPVADRISAAAAAARAGLVAAQSIRRGSEDVLRRHGRAAAAERSEGHRRHGRCRLGPVGPAGPHPGAGKHGSCRAGRQLGRPRQRHLPQDWRRAVGRRRAWTTVSSVGDTNSRYG